MASFHHQNVIPKGENSSSSSAADLRKETSHLKIDSRVEVFLSAMGAGAEQKVFGTIRYFGETQFKPGVWVGVELDAEHHRRGKNNGSVQGVKYFNCDSSNGMVAVFVRPENVKLLKQRGFSLTEKKDDEDNMEIDQSLNNSSAFTSLFNMNTRAFNYSKDTKEWIPIGGGDTFFRWVSSVGKFWLSLNSHVGHGLDHFVEPTTKIDEANVINNQSWVFRAIPASKVNLSKDQIQKEVLCLQFQTSHEARVFVSTFEGCRKSMLKVAMNSATQKDSPTDSTKEAMKSKARIKTLRRRLTVSGNDPMLDGHLKGARLQQEAAKNKVSTNQNSSSALERTILHSYSGISCKGVAPYNPDKQNQDSMIMEAMPFHGSPNHSSTDMILSVFDGHGENGHTVSRYFQMRIPQLLCHAKGFAVPENVGRILKEALLVTENEIINDCSVDTTLSGTTAVVTLLRGNQLFIANVGDSRIIKGKYDTTSGKILAQDLSIDHKPDSKEEQARIERVGGRVFAMKYDDGIDGPARVWLSYADMPGLAMSRSMCDTVAKEAGVISEAELFTETIDSNDKFIVLATDGLWEFMSSQEVADIVTRHMNPPNAKAAIDELVQESNRRWREEEPVIDDTTVIVGFFK